MSWTIKQRVDFYLPEFRPPVLPRRIRLLLVGLVAHCVVLLLVTGVFSGVIRYEQQQTQQLQAQQSPLQRAIAEQQALRPPLVEDPHLLQQRQQARTQLQTAQSVLMYLSRQQLQESRSFTPLVMQLAEQDVAGIWLAEFGITQQGRAIALKGYVDQPAKLSRYVSTLLARPAYQGRSFRVVDVRQSEHAWMVFELNSEARADVTAQGLRP